MGVLRGWQARHWAAALGGAALAAALVGVPTGIIRTSLYHRMTPVLWWNYPVWAATALLEGFLLASYVRAGAGKTSTGRATAGGVLSFLAVGCPVCNKLVVLAIGANEPNGQRNMQWHLVRLAGRSGGALFQRQRKCL